MRFGDWREVLWIDGNNLTGALVRVGCYLEAARVWSVALHGGTRRDNRGGTQLSGDSSELRGCHASDINVWAELIRPLEKVRNEQDHIICRKHWNVCLGS